MSDECGVMSDECPETNPSPSDGVDHSSLITPHSSLEVLIPAYNEADRIGATVAAVKSAIEGRVIVVDDGSADDTADAAREAGADVIVAHETNRGKGAALNTALAVSRAPLLLMIDADLGESAAEVAPLVEPVALDEADMAVAAFPKGPRKSGVGFAQALARWGIRLRTGKTFESPISGQRCVRREWVERLGGFAEGFAVEVALTVGVLHGGGRVVEVPLPLSHRKTGRTLAGFRHRAVQALAILRALRDA